LKAELSRASSAKLAFVERAAPPPVTIRLVGGSFLFGLLISASPEIALKPCAVTMLLGLGAVNLYGLVPASRGRRQRCAEVHHGADGVGTLASTTARGRHPPPRLHRALAAGAKALAIGIMLALRVTLG
jgi:hypothetical protein